jgi:hypothetical protein
MPKERPNRGQDASGEWPGLKGCMSRMFKLMKIVKSQSERSTEDYVISKRALGPVSVFSALSMLACLRWSFWHTAMSV